MEWIGRERSIEGREFNQRGKQQEKELHSASVENELRFNLDGSAKQVLDEQKENGCKMGRLCIEFLTQEAKSKESFSTRVYIREIMESETSLSL